MAKRYEYKFVSVKLKGGFWTGKAKEDYRQDIIQNGRDGWRFVQAFAPPVGGYGVAGAADLSLSANLGWSESGNQFLHGVDRRSGACDDQTVPANSPVQLWCDQARLGDLLDHLKVLCVDVEILLHGDRVVTDKRHGTFGLEPERAANANQFAHRLALREINSLDEDYATLKDDALPCHVRRSLGSRAECDALNFHPFSQQFVAPADQPRPADSFHYRTDHERR